MLSTLNSLDHVKEEINNHPFCLLFLSTKDCGVCTAVLPRINKMLQQYPLVHGIACKIDEVKALSGEYMVFTVPTILILVQGKEVYRTSRFIDFNQLDRTLSFFSRVMEEKSDNK